MILDLDKVNKKQKSSVFFLLSGVYYIKAKFIVMHCSETDMLNRIDFF